MSEKVSKFINVLKKDGIIVTVKKTYKYCMANYINKINIIRKIEFKLNKRKIVEEFRKVLNESDYDRIIVWRGSFGWNVPLYQRPQHIAKCLSNMKCLILYEVTRMTDKTKFVETIKDNLVLINYEIKEFEEIIWQELLKTSKPKYLQLYSTCWDVSDKTLDKYINNGFKLLYEYIDDLNPALAGTTKLPENVEKIHNYVSNNVDNVLVITSADRLYKDITKKRKSNKNVILSSNGVDYEHFKNTKKENIINKTFQSIVNENKKIIGYYGALASWVDYELLRNIANKYKDLNIVLIGIKYDNSFDESKIIECENIKYIGAIGYNELPNYAQYFNVCMIPFKINDITKSTNPIKVFEYMALGKPIITTAMPECKKYKSVFIAESTDEFIDLINKTLKINNKDNKEYFELLEKEALQNTWASKANDIIDLLKEQEHEN